MTQYCIECQNVEASKENGKYIELQDMGDLGIYYEVFICYSCYKQKKGQ